MTVNRTKPVALLVIAAALMTACSTRSGAPLSEPRHDAKAAETREESAPQASVEDFAAVVAEHHAGWDEQVEELDSLCLDPATVPACHATYFTLSMQAETIRLALSALHKPDAPAYIGVPPEKIADLLNDTESAADTASIAAADVVDAAGCDDPLADTCIEQRFAADGAIEELSGKLDAWAVYS